MSDSTARFAVVKNPTFWVVVVLLIGFVYLQWPTHLRTPYAPDYRTVTLADGVQMQWEGEPQVVEGEAGTAWTFKNKGLDFLVQQGDLNASLTQLAQRQRDIDRAQVGGIEYAPLEVRGSLAQYALIDAENRIQRHRLYQRGERWLKVSVLYKANNEEREARAQVFLNSVVLP
ncbi:hypothetical protein BGP77_14755 [Saccharospirillum sp. MSK14-1]|uniref:hypothetical protein n=1 Tax=Saccharospirillum sp. MSK14-1 TaxID=1897632 RepID=UPI000D36445B|nr:hypothetical protein [Saccharospirillum sp. MSK14-1]PTY37740.1 hypothetical protein BGP77_14755 [Saccharospirillum sp. MSK14-1]